MQQFSGKADWISFVMHFVFGLFIGCLMGVLTLCRRGHGIWLQEELILPYLSGTSMFCAGLGAKMGDRLWMGDSYRVIPPDTPKHDQFSLCLSILAMIFGAALAVISLYRHFF